METTTLVVIHISSLLVSFTGYVLWQPSQQLIDTFEKHED